jgi:predicted 3-demethylubiquinone-9 3-methyltransferase (glyoxalase superfamily)
MKNNPIRTCLWFNGQAKEAATFYCSIFKNSKITADNPVVTTFSLNGLNVMALNGGPMYKINPSISLFATISSLNTLDEIWNKLIDGGKALIGIDKYPWNERYGWLQDKFGMTWQLSFSDKKDDDQNIKPCLLFTSTQFGHAEEAVNYYTNVFKNSSITRMIHYPPGDANAGKVMYSEFKLGDNEFCAMDGPGEHNYTFSEGVSLSVDCENQNEIDYFWDAFTRNGEESMCGWVKDQFGVSWQIVPYNMGTLMNDPQKSQRVMQQLLKMRKLDMAVLENA